MQDVSAIIHARWVAPIRPKNILLETHSVIIQNDKILDILPQQQAIKQYCSHDTRELNQHIVIPGLINCHTHCAMNLFRGLADDLPLMSWLQDHIWPAEEHLMNVDNTILGTELAIAEMIRGGTTCFNDHYFFTDTIRQVAERSGIRATLGLHFTDVGNQWVGGADESLAKAEELITHTSPHNRLSWALAPHAPYTVPDTTLADLKKLSDRFDLPVHIHLHEVAAGIEKSLARYQQRPLQRLAKFGLLNDRLIGVHMVHLTEEDIKLTAENGVHVVHCPESNLKLASGIAPIKALLDNQVNIALGTDSVASNNDLDMLSEMRTAALLAKGSSLDPTTLPSTGALEMATINGAKALGLEDKIGSLEPGKQADITAVNLGELWQQPNLNPISQLVYSSNANMVSDVWVAGKALLKDQNFTHIDTPSILARLKQLEPAIKPFVHFP